MSAQPIRTSEYSAASKLAEQDLFYKLVVGKFLPLGFINLEPLEPDPHDKELLAQENFSHRDFLFFTALVLSQLNIHLIRTSCGEAHAESKTTLDRIVREASNIESDADFNKTISEFKLCNGALEAIIPDRAGVEITGHELADTAIEIYALIGDMIDKKPGCTERMKQVEFVITDLSRQLENGEELAEFVPESEYEQFKAAMKSLVRGLKFTTAQIGRIEAPLLGSTR